jgi:hypothetical protein
MCPCGDVSAIVVQSLATLSQVIFPIRSKRCIAISILWLSNIVIPELVNDISLCTRARRLEEGTINFSLDLGRRHRTCARESCVYLEKLTWQKVADCRLLSQHDFWIPMQLLGVHAETRMCLHSRRSCASVYSSHNGQTANQKESIGVRTRNLSMCIAL